MVKKLFKHEFLSLMRLLLPVYAILIGESILGRIMQIFESDSIVYITITVFSAIVYFISISAVFMLTTVFCVVRFYKNMFTGEGYLTFTLPVTPTQHIMVKTLTAMAFQVFSALSVIISLSILTMGDASNEIIKAAVYLYKMIDPSITPHLWLYALEIIILMILAGGVGIMLFYTCITIGQTFNKNRILGAVGVYFGYQVAMQILSSIFSIMLSVFVSEEVSKTVARFIEAHIKGFIHSAICGSILLSALLGMVYFIIIKAIITKKLNLE